MEVVRRHGTFDDLPYEAGCAGCARPTRTCSRRARRACGPARWSRRRHEDQGLRGHRARRRRAARALRRRRRRALARVRAATPSSHASASRAARPTRARATWSRCSSPSRPTPRALAGLARACRDQVRAAARLPVAEGRRRAAPARAAPRQGAARARRRCVEERLIEAYERAGVDSFLLDVTSGRRPRRQHGRGRCRPTSRRASRSRLTRPFYIAGGHHRRRSLGIRRAARASGLPRHRRQHRRARSHGPRVLAADRGDRRGVARCRPSLTRCARARGPGDHGAQAARRGRPRPLRRPHADRARRRPTSASAPRACRSSPAAGSAATTRCCARSRRSPSDRSSRRTSSPASARSPPPRRTARRPSC